MTHRIRSRVVKFLGQLLSYGALLLIVSLAMDYWRGRDLPQVALPHATFEDIAGQDFLLTELSHQQLVVVYFWATWCGPCKVSTPSVTKLAHSYPVVSIALQSESTEALQNYLSQNAIAFPVVNDIDSTIAGEWGVAATPTILFIHKGKVVANTSGVSFYPGLWLRAWWLSRFS